MKVIADFTQGVEFLWPNHTVAILWLHSFVGKSYHGYGLPGHMVKLLHRFLDLILCFVMLMLPFSQDLP